MHGRGSKRAVTLHQPKHHSLEFPTLSQYLPSQQDSQIPIFPPRCTHISQAGLHPVCSGWLWLLPHSELSHCLGTAGLLGHTRSLCGTSVLADSMWHLQRRHSQSLLAWGSLPGSRENAELPSGLCRGEHALGCSLCVKVARRNLNMFLPWELVLRAAQQ